MKYQIITVEKIDAPKGLPGENWYHYVIGHGNSKIDGSRPGTLQDVTLHAEQLVVDINSRCNQTTGTSYTRRRYGMNKKPEESK